MDIEHVENGSPVFSDARLKEVALNAALAYLLHMFLPYVPPHKEFTSHTLFAATHVTVGVLTTISLAIRTKSCMAPRSTTF